MHPGEGYLTSEERVRLFFQTMGSGSQVVVIPNATYTFNEFRYLADDRTVIWYDLRNRGRSDSVRERSRLEHGVHHDVEDLEAVRRYFGLEQMALIAHSYVGMVVGVYAMRHPAHVSRIVQIAPTEPHTGKQYPAHLTGADATMADVSGKMAQLQTEAGSMSPQEFGKKMWALMRQLYVADPANADKITWSVEHLPNESLLNVMQHYNENLLPSMRSLNLTTKDFAKATMPALIIHGTKDRHAPYGGAIDWAHLLPNARLITVNGAAHLPWLEAPEVFGSIETFIDGRWPDAARPV
jgi:proline iminopeptidase